MGYMIQSRMENGLQKNLGLDPDEALHIAQLVGEDGKYYYDQAVEKGVERKQFSEGEDLSRYDILVDCLLGTGFSGPCGGRFNRPFRPSIGPKPMW